MAYETSPGRRKIMASIRSRDTSPELLLRRELHGRGFRYRVNFGSLPGKPDIVFTRWHIAVFVHGCFWHNHPDCPWWTMPKNNAEFWIEKFAGNRDRDRRVRQALLDIGWRPIVIWECEIRGSVVNAADLIEEVVGKQRETFVGRYSSESD